MYLVKENNYAVISIIKWYHEIKIRTKNLYNIFNFLFSIYFQYNKVV